MKRTLLSLLSILVLSTALNAQETYLVANGTTTNSYVPIYGFYTEQYQRCQTIYPSSMLEEINGGQILSIKYFLSSTSSSAINSIFQVKIGEVTPSSFSSSTFQNTTNFQTVYTGTFNTTQSTLTITFDEPYSYSGGNLLIEVNDITPSNYSSCSFYGISQTGGSSQGYTSSSWSSVSGTIRDFIPKTEFTAEVGPQTCPKPTVSDPIIDDMTATINWTENGTATQYAIYLNNSLVQIVNNVTTYTFRDLTPITDYVVKVKAICGEGDTSFASSKSFTTPCITESLPYNEGFEGFTAGSSNMAPCWTSVSGTNYVQANTSYSTYSAAGNNCLHLAGGTVITPPLNTNGRAIEVVFSAKAESTSSSGTIQVGFTNDPTNLNGVQWATPIQPANTNHNVYEVQFTTTGTSSTGYVVFKQNATYSSYYYWLDEIYIGVLSDCRKPENLTVYTVDRTGAAIGWEAPMNLTPDAYYFEWRASGSITWNGESVRDPYKFMTGLTLGTAYEIRVRSICGEDTSRDVHTTFVTQACDLELGGGVTTNSTVPLNSGWNYSYTQMLYPASELRNLDTIYGISFYLTSASSRTFTMDCYIGNTSASSVSTSSYVASSTMTRKVQNRQITFHSGWNDITFTSPFIYDGSSNIVIAVDNNTGSYTSGNYYRHHTTTGASSCHWYQDSGGDIYPSQPSASYTGNLSTVPDIKFITPCTQDACRAPLLLPSDIESHSVTLHWEPMGSATSWKVEYKQSTASNWTTANANVTAHEYVLNNLTAGVTYDFKVTSNCTGTDNSAEVSAFTRCDLFDLTYREEFASGRINPCWATSTASPNYPTVFSGKLYTGPDAGSWIILPEFVEEVGNLMLTFDVNSSSETGTLKVGVTTGQDISTFTEIETVSYTDSIINAEIYYDNYTGNGTNIAIKFTSGYTLVDNIEVSIAPTCRRPNNIRVDEVEASTATLSWDAGQNAIGATVKYRRVGGRWSTVTTTGNSVTLTGLVANMPYDVIIKADCGDGDMSENSDMFTFRTGCADGSTRVTEGYPFIEGFEYGLFCWQQEFEAQTLEWVTKKGDGESNMGAHGIEEAYLDDKNALFYNLLVYTAGPKTRIISPMLNTEGLAEPWLRYAYGLTRYTDRDNNQQYSDEMSVYYRTTATGPWVQLKNHTTATTGWVLDSIALPATSTTFQISFLGNFKGGNGVALDDVRVYTAGHPDRVDDEPPSAGIEERNGEAWSFSIFPNPASGSTTISIEGVSGRVNIAIMDMSGRTVRNDNRECHEGCTQTLELQGLAQGAYFVRVSGEKVNSVKKLVVR
ncbi:MAG: fibronectin type III domain-containing protein [Bacteroidales bacterium]|nr:fibronectin type III domain-containing protein [Bacteroidales bacterium]